MNGTSQIVLIVWTLTDMARKSRSLRCGQYSGFNLGQVSDRSRSEYTDNKTCVGEVARVSLLTIALTTEGFESFEVSKQDK